MFNLTGHTALVTGGNAGLGLAMARGLARAGASVAIWGRDVARNAAAREDLASLGGDVADFACDVTDPAAVEAAMAATLERMGHIDSCFANAGGSGIRGPFLNLSAEDWRKTMDLNFTSVVCTFQAAVRHYLARGGGGRLIVTSSIAATMGIPMAGGYSASKSAAAALVRNLAVELAGAGIVANAILPGFIETAMSLDTPKAFQDAARRRTPSGQIGTLQDMEGIAVFLAAPESRLITGQSIVIDGGQSIFPM